MSKLYKTNSGCNILINSLEEINFANIFSKFNLIKSTGKRTYILPRIAFIGNFRNLSQSDQRHIAKYLGFEYVQDIPFGVSEQNQMQNLSTIWHDITKDFTKLIILGEPCIKIDDNGDIEFDTETEGYLFKRYKRDKIPVFLKYNIPIMLESEIVKIHKNYPLIDNNTTWKSEYLKPEKSFFNYKHAL